MASTVTHAFFILDVYDRLDIRTKKLLLDQKELLKIAAQGMDPFFFYRILHPKKGARMREFGGYFHEHFTFEYFETMIHYIKYNGYAANPQVMAFLYGALSHYILDSNIHPFVIYKTGVFDKSHPDTYRYNMLHEEVESMLDAYLIGLRKHVPANQFKAYQFCFEKVYFSPVLEEVVNFTFKEVFDVHNMTKFYKRSLQDMKMFFHVFRYDPYRLKYLFYQFVDWICPNTFRRKVPLSYAIKINYDYFNLQHKTWYHPTSKKIKSKSSILDIYTSSLAECVQTIQKIQNFIYEDEGVLKDILKNVSYSTGRDVTKQYSFKYFDF